MENEKSPLIDKYNEVLDVIGINFVENNNNKKKSKKKSSISKSESSLEIKIDEQEEKYLYKSDLFPHNESDNKIIKQEDPPSQNNDQLAKNTNNNNIFFTYRAIPLSKADDKDSAVASHNYYQFYTRTLWRNHLWRCSFCLALIVLFVVLCIVLIQFLFAVFFRSEYFIIEQVSVYSAPSINDKTVGIRMLMKNINPNVCSVKIEKFFAKIQMVDPKSLVTFNLPEAMQNSSMSDERMGSGENIFKIETLVNLKNHPNYDSLQKLILGLGFAFNVQMNINYYVFGISHNSQIRKYQLLKEY